MAPCTRLVAAMALALATTLLVGALPRSAFAATPPATPAATLRPTARPTAKPTARPTARPGAPATGTPRAEATPRAALSPTPSPAAASPLATPAAPASADPQLDLLAAGQLAYTTLGCGGCHTLAAAGTTGVFGPSHEQIASTAALRLADPAYHGSATTVAEFLREAIVDPEAYVPEAYKKIKYRMPAFTHATAAQVDALVAFLLQQK